MGDSFPSQVAVIRCDSYDGRKLERGLRRAIELLGGIHGLFDDTDSAPILLKPNMLAPEDPESAAVTHYAVFEAVARALGESGRTLVYGDSPAIHPTVSTARRTGIHAAAERAGVEAASFRESRRVTFEAGRQNKVFPIARACLDAGAIVNIAKLKTHGFMVMTGAVKNMFGCVPGLEKARFHARVEIPRLFARMIVDLNLLLRPRLSVIDAVVAMEGNGPRNGTPLNVGVLLVSRDPVAADTVAARLLGIDPRDVATIAEGHAAGLGTMEDIELVGDPLPTLKRPAVRARGKADLRLVPRLLRGLVKKILAQAPVIHRDKCVRCYECLKICPTEPKSIRLRQDRFPQHVYETCIRCYCCQETCPANAITIRRKLFAPSPDGSSREASSDESE